MSNPERGRRSRHGSCALRLLLRGGIVIGVFVTVLQVVTLGPLLPTAIVTGFAWDGAVRAWTSTPAFLTTYLVVIASTAAMFLALPPLLRAVAWRQGSDVVDPQHASRLASFEEWTLFLGLGSTTFAVAIVHAIAVANLARPPHLDATVPVLLMAYGVFATTWTVQMVRRFRRQPMPSPTPVSA